jgi:uncharacterized membrane protein
VDKITQDKINNSEWQDPDNWGEPKYWGLYFSKEDSRIKVPKRNPSMGWTINVGHRSAPFWLFGIFGLFYLLGFLIGGGLTYILMRAFIII